MSSRKISSIENLHNTIDDTSRMINQKTNLIEDLQNKKLAMINSVESTLNQCRNNERTLYNRWVGSLSSIGLSKLNEYAMYISRQHDEGSVIIGQINASKNFQQLDRVEREMYNPYIAELRESCSLY